MRLSITNNKNSSSFYIIKSVTVDGKRTSKVIERLGNYEEVKIKKAASYNLRVYLVAFAIIVKVYLNIFVYTLA